MTLHCVGKWYINNSFYHINKIGLWWYHAYFAHRFYKNHYFIKCLQVYHHFKQKKTVVENVEDKIYFE